MTRSEQPAECQWAQAVLFDVRDEKRLQLHLAQCAACRAVQAWDESVTRQLRSAKGPRVSLVDEVRHRLRRRTWQRLAAVACAASVLLLMSLAWWRLRPGDTVRPNEVVKQERPTPRQQKEVANDQPTMLAAFGQSAPVVELRVVDRHQDALTSLLEDLAKEAQ